MKDAASWISNRFVERHPRDAAKEFEHRSVDEAATLLAELPPEAAAAILSHMHAAAAAGCMLRLKLELVSSLLEHMSPNVAARIARQAGGAAADQWLDDVPPSAASAIRKLARFAPGSVGAVVEVTNPALPRDTTVADARKPMRVSPSPYLYVTDRDHRLVGVIGDALWSGRPNQLLEDVMYQDVTRLSANAEVSAVLSHPAWSEFDTLPAVDVNEQFVGVVRHKTLRRILGARATGSRDDPMVATFLRLAELYWIGVTATLASLRINPPPLRQGSQETELGVSNGA